MTQTNQPDLMPDRTYLQDTLDVLHGIVAGSDDANKDFAFFLNDPLRLRQIIGCLEYCITRPTAKAASPDLGAEEWRPVAGYESYCEVSSLGRFRRLTRSVFKAGPDGIAREYHYGVRIMKQSKRRDGYMRIRFMIGKNDRLHFQSHCLVARTFLGPQIDGLHVNHINGDKTDNRLENLEYVTHRENAHHHIRRTMGKSPGVQKTKSGRFSCKARIGGISTHIGTFDSQSEAEHALNQAISGEVK